MAFIGQILDPVAPRKIVTPCLNGLVLDALILRATIEGLSWESTATSEMLRYAVGSY